MNNNEIYKEMLLIRTFEEKVQELFDKKELYGTGHLCIGQEFPAVSVCNNINRDDIVTGTHRSHGHYIAHTKDVNRLMAELFGKETGVCGGIGGTQHLSNGSTFYSNGITGGMIPVATGMAMAEKMNNSNKIVVAFTGDGALGQGVVYESLNIASLYKLPILYVFECNNYAISTRVKAPSLMKLSDALDISYTHIDNHTINMKRTKNLIKKSIENVRIRRTPEILKFDTWRLCPHSKSGNNCYRNKEEEELKIKLDILNSYEISEELKNQYKNECNDIVNNAIKLAQGT